MKISKNTQTLMFLSSSLLLLLFSSFIDDGLVCPPGCTWNGSNCVDGGGIIAQKSKAIGALVNPPHSTSELKFNGNQSVNIQLTNSNILFAPVTVNCNYQNPPNADWNVLLSPGGKDSKTYTVFRSTPIPWKFTTSTNADAVLVSIVATWYKLR